MHHSHKMKGFWILLSLTLASMLFMNLPVSPSYGEKITGTTVFFKTFGPSQTILIDDTAAFTSPQIVLEDEPITLQPGIYYWKTTGISLVSTFTLVSTVSLTSTPQYDNQQRVKNIGTVPVTITSEPRRSLTGAFILNPNNELTLPLEQEMTLFGEEKNDA